MLDDLLHLLQLLLHALELLLLALQCLMLVAIGFRSSTAHFVVVIVFQLRVFNRITSCYGILGQ